MPGTEPMSRERATRVAVGGGVGGVLLLALSLFLLGGLAEDATRLVGVFLVLAVALLVLALVAVLTGGLRHGEGAPGRRFVSLAWRGLGVLGLVVVALAVVRGELPWIAFAIVPLLVVVVLLRGPARTSRTPAG
ncbi:hypothetical protein [Phycicoccus avicenniae]|uniref:hypothetical protein n=1 Tax=Phycicoccus avicenniae TaxID=2828860 RepID=UPI003D279551